MSPERTNRIPRFRVVVAAVLGLGLLLAAEPGAAAEPLPVLAQVGPWPVASKLIGYRGRLWLANSVKGRNHNSADLYSYDPETGGLRYERHLFSQDAGDPLVANGLLYWPFEDTRFSLGWGQVMVTDGKDWSDLTLPTARIFHAHAMAWDGKRLIAATSAWRAGLQESLDGGLTWREIYDHPTAERRVSRIVDLTNLGATSFGYLTGWNERKLLRIRGDEVVPTPGWPQDRSVIGLTVFRDWVYGLVRGTEGTALWRTNGQRSERVTGPRKDWRPRDLDTDRNGLWLVSATAEGGRLWYSQDGEQWEPRHRLAGGEPQDLAVFTDEVYVAGTGKDGRGILWGPSPPAVSKPSDPAPSLPSIASLSRPPVDWQEAGRRLDATLTDEENFEDHGKGLRELLFDLARADPPEDFLSQRLQTKMPDKAFPLIGDIVRVSASRLGRWLLLWAMSLAGEGRVPIALLEEPWTAAQNASEKYFDPPPAAFWAIAASGQDDRRTVDALINRLGRQDDPDWLRGDLIGALSAITGERLAYDIEAWQDWWREAKLDWPEPGSPQATQ